MSGTLSDGAGGSTLSLGQLQQVLPGGGTLLGFSVSTPKEQYATLSPGAQAVGVATVDATCDGHAKDVPAVAIVGLRWDK